MARTARWRRTTSRTDVATRAAGNLARTTRVRQSSGNRGSRGSRRRSSRADGRGRAIAIAVTDDLRRQSKRCTVSIRAITHRYSRLIAIATMGLLLCACGSLRYYAQAVHGQGELIVHRRAVSTVLRDPTTSSALAARLRHAQQARQFASRSLGLPDNRSYTGYVDLHRSYVVWNVFATPRYSVNAVPQCFPVTGCVAYRGWFNEAAAKTDAARLQAPRRRRLDRWRTSLFHARMVRGPDPLQHAALGRRRTGRHDLSRAGASVDLREGRHGIERIVRYLRADPRSARVASPPRTPAAGEHRMAMDDSFARPGTRSARATARSCMPVASTRVDGTGKQREIAAFRTRYAQLAPAHWPDDHRYDAWVAAPINNAQLLPFGLYERWSRPLPCIVRTRGGAAGSVLRPRPPFGAEIEAATRPVAAGMAHESALRPSRASRG